MYGNIFRNTNTNAHTHTHAHIFENRFGPNLRHEVGVDVFLCVKRCRGLGVGEGAGDGVCNATAVAKNSQQLCRDPTLLFGGGGRG